MFIKEALKGSDTYRPCFCKLLDPADRPIMLRERCQFGYLSGLDKNRLVPLCNQCGQSVSQNVDPFDFRIGIANVGNQVWVIKAGQTSSEIKLRVRRPLCWTTKKHAKAAHRCSRSYRPPIAREMSMAEIAQNAVDPTLRWIERNSIIIDGSNTDISRWVIEHLLVMKCPLGKSPSHRPEPLNHTGEGFPGGMSSKVDMPHHLHWVDDAPSVGGKRAAIVVGRR